jgi:hypothetical protein
MLVDVLVAVWVDVFAKVLVRVTVAVVVVVAVFVAAIVDVLVGVSVGVFVGIGCTAQIGLTMMLDCNTTWPVCAKTLPLKIAPVFRLASVSARIFPKNEEVVPKVAELPTRHHTLQGSPPVIDEPGAVIRVDAVLKIQTPDPVKFKFPLSEKLLVEQ